MEMATKKIIEVYGDQNNLSPESVNIVFTANHYASARQVAQMLYKIYCSYLDLINDCDQIEYNEEVRYHLTELFRKGYNDVSVIDLPSQPTFDSQIEFEDEDDDDD